MQKTLIIVLLIGFCSFLAADWDAIGPEGGNLRSIVISPNDASVLYAASYTNPCKIVKSIDAGATWNVVGSYTNYNYCLAIDPSDVLYAGCGYAVYKSTNGGVTWTRYTVTSTYVYDLVVHPSNPSIIYGAGRRYVASGNYDMVFIKSTNGGSSWTITRLVGGNYCYGYSVAVDPQNPNTVYVGGCDRDSITYMPKIFKTTDGGSNFTEVYSATTGYYVYSLAVHPTNSNIVYAGTYLNGIHRTTNGGGSWTKVSTYAYNYRMRTTPDDPDLVFSSGNTSVYKSTNAGATWTIASTGLRGSYFYGLAIDPTNASIVYTTNRAGCFKTTDMGSNWYMANSGIDIGLPIVYAAVAPSAPLTVYTQVEDIGVYKTFDCGSNWDLCPLFSSCGDMISMAVKYDDPNTCMAIEGFG